MKFLIIDDSQTARMFTKKCTLMALPSLKAEITFIEATNGEEALEKLNLEKVDLILSDVNMPVMTGFTFIRNIKMLDKLKDIPVIFITSLANDARKDNLLQLGAFAVTGKPTNPKILSESLLKLPFIEKRIAELNNQKPIDQASNNTGTGWGA